MTTIAIWLLFIGNYLILYTLSRVNLYFENIMFFLYTFNVLLLNLNIYLKILRIRVGFKSVLLLFFILTLLIPLAFTFSFHNLNSINKLLYIFVSIVVCVDGYLIAFNKNVIDIDPKLLLKLSILSAFIMISLALYDVLILHVYRIGTGNNAIGTARAITISFIIIFSLTFYYKKFKLSSLIYATGLFISFISGTRQVFASFMLLGAIFFLVPLFKNKPLFSISNTIKSVLFLSITIFVTFVILSGKTSRAEVSKENFSYLASVLHRYHGGHEGKYIAISERQTLLLKSIDTVSDNPLLGDFTYNLKLGNFAHLMFLDLYATFGVFAVIVFIFLNLIILKEVKFSKLKKDPIYLTFFLLYIFFQIPGLIITTFLIHPFYYFTVFYLFGYSSRKHFNNNLS